MECIVGQEGAESIKITTLHGQSDAFLGEHANLPKEDDLQSSDWTKCRINCATKPRCRMSTPGVGPPGAVVIQSLPDVQSI